MPGGDPASSPLASTRHTPADDADSLHDLLAEPLLLARLAAPRTDRTGAVITGPNGIAYDPISRARVTALVSAQIASAGLDDAAPGKPQIIELLTMLSCDENHTLAIRALCWLRLLGHEGRSLDAIGAEFGVVRATVDAIYRGIQKRYEARGIILTSRGDKSPAARKACQERRRGKRKLRAPWAAQKLWPKLSPPLPSA
jgi:hypothetical protein